LFGPETSPAWHAVRVETRFCCVLKAGSNWRICLGVCLSHWLTAVGQILCWLVCLSEPGGL